MQNNYANIRRSEKPRMGCRSVRGGERGNAGAPVYLGHVAVLSKACDVFQGVGGVTDRAVMWGCLRETLQIIRERREVQGGLVVVVELVCIACNRNNVLNYKEVLKIFKGLFFVTFPWEGRIPVLRQNANHPLLYPSAPALLVAYV